MELKPLNKVCDKWSEFADEYFIGDDGFIYRRLKSNYFRSGRKHPYQQVRNCFGSGKRHTVHLHQAVARAFLGAPQEGEEVDHINNDKTDNRVENLQWLSHKENCSRRKGADA